MRGLTIIVAEPNATRFAAALRLAATSAAAGARTRLFLDEAAVALLAADGHGAMVETCLDLGAALIVCQAGLAGAGLDLRALDPRLEGGGLIWLLATLGDDRLVAM